MEKNDKIEILYIAGSGRGGSTLIGDVMGLLPYAFHIGELRGVFDYTRDKNIVCSCHNEYKDCPFWGEIFRDLYGSSWSFEFKNFSIEGKLPRALKLPLLTIKKKLFGKFYNYSLENIFLEICRILVYLKQKISYQVLIDSSKSASFAWCLAQQPNVKIVVVHIVRDPRAVLYSWTKRAIPIFDYKKQYSTLKTRNLFDGVQDWIRSTLGAAILKYIGIPYMRIKYEDFVSNPVEIVTRICDFAKKNGIALEVDDSIVNMLNNKRLIIEDRHIIGGNPGVKRRIGAIQIRKDDAWLKDLSVLQRIFLTFIFLPWLLWLDYELFPEK